MAYDTTMPRSAVLIALIMRWYRAMLLSVTTSLSQPSVSCPVPTKSAGRRRYRHNVLPTFSGVTAEAHLG